MENWQAIHLFVAKPRDLDLLALEAAAAFATAAEGAFANDWFFIRYGEGGLHLRLRIGSRASAQFSGIRKRMADICRLLAEGRAPAAGTDYADGEQRLFAAGETIDTPYEPETVRYGGPDGLVIHEELFRRSTKVAIALIKATRDDLPRRSAIATDLMLMTMAAMLTEEDPAEFVSHYSASWRTLWKDVDVAPGSTDAVADLRPRYARHVRAARSAERPTNPIDAWGHEVTAGKRAIEQLHRDGRLASPSTGRATGDEYELRDALRSFAHSQIHMLNNRLGLWPAAEIILAERLERGLSQERL